MDYSVTFCTCSGRDEAKKILSKLLEEKLVACGNMVSNIESMYRWKGKIEISEEVLLILKSESQLNEKIAGLIQHLHSYDVPEIFSIPIQNGNKEYLKWISESLN